MNGKPARVAFLVILLLTALGCDRCEEAPSKPIAGLVVERLRPVMQAVDPLFIKKGKPAPGEQKLAPVAGFFAKAAEAVDAGGI